MAAEAEPLLKENPNRFTTFPVQYVDIWDMYKKAEKAIWHVSEVNLMHDLADWERLTSEQKHFIKYVLAFFAGSDGIVNENLALRFFNEIQCPEARCFYGTQIFIENIHSEMYSRLLDVYIGDTKEKKFLFDAIYTIPCIGKKARWALKWIGSNVSFATRLIAFAIVEGIFFSGSFCAIYWLNESGVMRGLAKANDFIARDEGLHTEFATVLYKYIVNRLSQEEAETIVREAVAIESEFITEALPCQLLGMNAEAMKKYIQFVADRLLKQLGYSSIYNAEQPFEFMDRIALRNKSNFFEDEPSEYARNLVAAESSAYADF